MSFQSTAVLTNLALDKAALIHAALMSSCENLLTSCKFIQFQHVWQTSIRKVTESFDKDEQATFFYSSPTITADTWIERWASN